MLDLLTRPLEVWRSSFTPDGGGGRQATQASVGTVLAKVDQPSASDQLVAAQEGAELTHVVYVAPTEDVQRGDELRDPDSGEVFVVDSTVQPSVPVYLRVNCHRTQHQGG